MPAPLVPFSTGQLISSRERDQLLNEVDTYWYLYESIAPIAFCKVHHGVFLDGNIMLLFGLSEKKNSPLMLHL